MMTKSRKEILDRTLANLEYIKGKPSNGGPFPVTQLVNSFLMTLLQNWDDMEDGWDQLSQKGVVWPNVRCSLPDRQPKACVGKIRDALAHGGFVFDGPEGGDIQSLRLWTCPPRNTTVDWDMTLSVEDMEKMLLCFVELANEVVLPTRTAKMKGDPCK